MLLVPRRRLRLDPNGVTGQKLDHDQAHRVHTALVRAKIHFVCNYCHEVVRIDRHQRTLALARHEPVMDVKGELLEQASDGGDGSDEHR
jgi:hypothetical protein